MRSLIIALLLLCGGYHAALANPVIWQIDAAACTPASDSVTNKTYSSSSGAVNQTGTQDVYLRCPVPATLTNAQYIEVVFKDSTGGTSPKSSTNYVEVCLWEVSLTTGAETSVMEFSSSGFSSSGVTDVVYLQNSYAFDANHTYYISVELSRDSTANTEEIFGVGLRQFGA